MDKNKQYEDFVSKLKSGETIEYSFMLDMDWMGYHHVYEKVNNDWIEGVTERLIDGDDGREWVTFEWKYDSEKNEFNCYVESDRDEKELEQCVEGDEELRFFFFGYEGPPKNRSNDDNKPIIRITYKR